MQDTVCYFYVCVRRGYVLRLPAELMVVRVYVPEYLLHIMYASIALLCVRPVTVVRRSYVVVALLR